MSRTFKGAFGIALGLLAVGLLLVAVAPNLGGALAIVALIALGCLVFVVNAMARRSPGWTRVVNPRAAHREAMAEVRRSRSCARAKTHGSRRAGRLNARRHRRGDRRSTLC